MSHKLIASLLAAVALGSQAHAQTYTTPHLSDAAGAETLTFGGQSFVNKGLVAVGHLSAATRDFDNETLGSFSGMALDLKTWRRNADGSYSAALDTLPDRGPNGVGPITGTTDYANRIHRHQIVLRAAAGVLTIAPDGGFLLRDETGKTMTGKDPGAGLLTRGGVTYPSPASGEGAGKISLDPEAVTRLADGGFYVSDEYAAGIYLFDKNGRQIGAIATVPALAPMTGGKLNFNGDGPPASGRRNNQGMEGLSVSPDGTRLFAVLQSAAVQDAASGGAAARNNTRILVYDISKIRTPAAPIGHYALTLPTYRGNGDGKAADSTAAQSEVFALNNHQLLVLSRDGNGRGKGSKAAPVFKSILLADIDGATNLAGSAYESGSTPIAKDGVLVDGIAPAKTGELVNLLNSVQLARFGMNLSVQPSTPMSIPEKIEAMALAPVLDPAAPDDYFLLVGSDNDFEAANGRINGLEFDASLKNAEGSGVGDNDNLILVYRVTLPTYRPR